MKKNQKQNLAQLSPSLSLLIMQSSSSFIFCIWKIIPSDWFNLGTPLRRIQSNSENIAFCVCVILTKTHMCDPILNSYLIFFDQLFVWNVKTFNPQIPHRIVAEQNTFSSSFPFLYKRMNTSRTRIIKCYILRRSCDSYLYLFWILLYHVFHYIDFSICIIYYNFNAHYGAKNNLNLWNALLFTTFWIHCLIFLCFLFFCNVH